MGYAKINSRCSFNGQAESVCVEVQIRPGNNACNIIGLPGVNVKESIDRVKNAIIAAGLSVPEHQITINLTPATIPKHGSHLDLAIALAILAASKQITCKFRDFDVFGELSLNGEISGNLNFLPLFYESWRQNKLLIYPKNLEQHTRYFEGIKSISCTNLIECIQYLNQSRAVEFTKTIAIPRTIRNQTMFAGIKGQSQAKRALSIAAAGGHHVLMIGSPGTGKSILARALHELLPDLTQQQALEAMCFSGAPPTRLPSFRAPHHSISTAGLVGGGLPIQAGEITKAHMGLLFTDELAEYSKQTIEMMREPVEKGSITIVRSGSSCTLPCNFQWIAALNPCPCGMYAHPEEHCRCNFIKRQAYINKLSNPLIDRFAIACKVNHSETTVDDYHFSILEINQAREIQEHKWGCTTQRLSPVQISKAAICPEAKSTYNYLTKKLSERQKHQILKVALTISYLEVKSEIAKSNILEAISFLPKTIISGYLTH